MNLKDLSGRVYLVGFIIVTVLAALFYIFVGSEAKNSISGQFSARQQVIARAESSNLTSYFQSLGNSVAVLAQLTSIEGRNAKTQADMDTFVAQRKFGGIIGGVVLTDKNGIAIFNSNVLGTHDIGQSVADRDYFIWAKSQKGEGGYYVSEPIISRLGGSKGKAIVLVTSPVFSNGVFTGIMGASVELAPLAQRYLDIMKVSDTTDVFLVDGKGQILYNNLDSTRTGSDMSTIYPVFKGLAGTTSEGTLQIAYPDPQGGENVSRIVAYAPVALGSQNWVIIMASPATDLWNIGVPMYIRLVVLFLIFVTTIFVFGLVVVREERKRGDQNRL